MQSENNWDGTQAHMLFPHTFARVASQGFWQSYRHLVYASKFIAPRIAKGNARICIEMPPRVGKSMFCTEWVPLWYLNNFHRKNLMIGAYNHDLASDFGRKIRNHLQFNPACPVRLSVDSAAADRFRTTTGGEVYAQGVGGAFTGRGADLMIIDDPFKDWKEASSEGKRRDVHNWWDSTAETRLEPNASVIIVNTRWHQADLTGYVTSKEGGDSWDVLSLPALCDDPLTDVLGRKLGEALCPERYDREFYLKKKATSPEMIFNALYQQKPTPPGGTIIQREWLQYYDVLPTRWDRIIQSWDFTFKDTDGSDYVVGQVWGVYRGNYYLIYQVRDRLSFTKSVQKMELVSKLFPEAFTVLVEEKANGAAIINVLQGKINGIKAIIPRESKAARLHSVAPIYQLGKVLYPRPEKAPWVPIHIEELVNFGGAPHDDTVDCATQALNELIDNSGDRIESLTLW